MVALTGLLLVGFLIEHLYGNLKLTPFFGTNDGRAFEEYRDELHSWGWLLQVAEVGLFSLFLAHAFLALRLTLENREARDRGYVVRNDRGARTLGSSSMFVTGALLLAFLVKHVTDFRFDGAYQEAPGETVAAILSRPLDGCLYLVAMLVLGVHLSHGLQSAFQSMGFGHPKWSPLIRAAGRGLALVFALGFALIPLYFLFRSQAS